MPLQGIVFDFDGVIADTERVHLAAFQDVLAKRGMTLGESEYYQRYLGYDDAGALRAIGNDRRQPFADDTVHELVSAKAERFAARTGAGAALFPGAAACIERLGAVAPLAIASGALHAEIDAILRAAGLRERFEAIVAADDVDRSKPAPDSYRRAVELLAAGHIGVTPATCVAIEDSAWGIEAAHAAGLACVGVTHSFPAPQLAAADLVLPGLDALQPDVLARLCGRRATAESAAP